MAVVGKPLRLPSIMAATRPAIPALMCTTVPPAKSSTPQSHNKPPAPLQTMCAIGAYTKVNQTPINQSMAENFIRSANAPTISTGVIMANVIWNVINTDSGMVSVNESTDKPLKNALLKPPTNEFRLMTPASMPVVSKARL